MKLPKNIAFMLLAGVDMDAAVALLDDFPKDQAEELKTNPIRGVREMALILDCSTSHVSYLVRRGRFPIVRIGGEFLTTRTILQRFKDEHWVRKRRRTAP